MITESLRNVFAIPELRRRLLFTFAMLAVYRVGCFLPTPGVDPGALQELMDTAGSGLLGFVNNFTGGSLARAAVFSLGIMPYITSSIILQLLTVVWPFLEKLSKEGEVGRKKITQYTRYLTVIIALVQSSSIAFFLSSATTPTGAPLVPGGGLSFILVTAITVTTGCAFVMWLGEQISERGIGNGISLIIFAGIVVGMVPALMSTFSKVQAGEIQLLSMILLSIFMLLVVAFIVFMERGQRRIPVQYAKRVIGRKVYGGQSTYLPLRINTGGVIPVIFASSVVMVPTAILGQVDYDWVQRIVRVLQPGEILYYVAYVLAIVFFSYFYISIIFNPQDVAENMRKHGGFIPGIRPGRRTSDYIDRILTRLTLVGSLYLAAVSVLPGFLLSGVRVGSLGTFGQRLDAFMPDWMTTGMGIEFFFGGTSLLIVVGVAMDFVQQVESQLVMRNYEGFMKKGRVRGRR